MAMPTPLTRPWPSGPVVASTPGVMPYSGWPGVMDPHWRKRLRSSRETAYPVRWSIEYRSMLACPADRTKRSRFGQAGSVGAWRRCFVHRAKVIGAMPMGAPGCPELACCTPSMDRVRMVSTASRSSWSVGRVIAVSGCAGRIGGTAGRRWGGGQRGAFGREGPSYRAGPPGGPSPPGHRRILPHMPSPSAPSRNAVPRRPAAPPVAPAVVVLGDLVVDVVLAPDRDLKRGTDVTGRVVLRQGGSAASTARWLGRLGARSTLVCAIGRDASGRALVAAASRDGVTVRAVRVAGAATGRIGVLVEPGGERSFVTERGAALRLRPEDLRPAWFAGADALHLPAYSLLDQPLGEAGMAAAVLAHQLGVLVSVDLSSSAPLLAKGRQTALSLILSAAPDVLFATTGRVAGARGWEARRSAAGPVADRGDQAGTQGRGRPRP